MTATGTAAARVGGTTGPLAPLLLQGTVLAAGFVSGALLARSLGPATRGDYQVVVLLYTMAAPVLGLGLGSGLSAGARRPWPRPSCLAALVGATALAGSTAVLASGLPPGPTAVLCALLWAPLLSPLTEAYLLRAGRPALVQRLRVVDVASTSVLVAVLYVLGMLTVLTAALALLVPTAVLRLGVAVWAVRAAGPASTRPGPTGLARLLRCTVRRYWPWDAVVAATASIDVLVAALVLPRPALGVYAVAAAVGRLALAPFSAVAPYLTAAGAQDRLWSAVWRRWLRLPALLVVAFFAVLAAWPQGLVGLVYGTAFRAAGVAAVVLVAAFALQGLTTALEAHALGHRGRTVSPLPRVVAAVALAGAALLVDHVGALDATGLALLTLLYGAVACGATAVRHRRDRAA